MCRAETHNRELSPLADRGARESECTHGVSSMTEHARCLVDKVDACNEREISIGGICREIPGSNRQRESREKFVTVLCKLG